MELNILLLAALGVFFFGIAKGGFAGPISMLAVPLMSLVMSPLKAAGILLPLLVLMDIIAVWIFWKKWNIKILKIIVPASIVGIVFGAFTFQYTSENQIRLVVGIITILFEPFFKIVVAFIIPPINNEPSIVCSIILDLLFKNKNLSTAKCNLKKLNKNTNNPIKPVLIIIVRKVLSMKLILYVDHSG